MSFNAKWKGRCSICKAYFGAGDPIAYTPRAPGRPAHAECVQEGSPAEREARRQRILNPSVNHLEYHGESGAAKYLRGKDLRPSQ